MMKKLKKIKSQLILSFVIILLGVLSVYLLVSTFNAKATGTDIGSEIGSVVGKAIGSANAVANADEFLEKGKEAGLSAEDTEITEVENAIKITGKLRILSADVSLDILHSVGEDEEYKALYYMEGKINFTVDLSAVETRYDEPNDTLIVIIPEPTSDLKINSDSVKKLVDNKKGFSLIPADAGSEGYINTTNEVKGNIRDYVENYDSLLKIAEDEAVIRVEELVESLSFAGEAVVKFAGGEQ